MLVAKDFRAKARAALSGNWAMSIGAGFVASLLGAYTVFTSGSGVAEVEEEQKARWAQTLTPEMYTTMIEIVEILVIISVIYAIIMLFIGGPISLGYSKFNLALVDGKKTSFTELFSCFDRYGEGFLIRFLRMLYVFLWTFLAAIPCVIVGAILMSILLSTGRISAIIFATYAMVICIIPAAAIGVIKTYSYAMASYVMYENPGISANTAIKMSIDLMKGNKWRLFCLAISFIGWRILSIFTLFIGLLWVKPYEEAAYAAFYREVYRERYGEPVKEQTTYSYEQDSFYQGYSQGNNDFNK